MGKFCRLSEDFSVSILGRTRQNQRMMNSASDGGDGGGDDGAVQCSSASSSAVSSSAPISPTSYQCPAAGCVKQYDKLTSMKTHVFYKHANDAALLQQVARLFENAPRIPCEVCDKTFKNSGSLLKHRREVHHVKVSSSSACLFCSDRIDRV